MKPTQSSSAPPVLLAQVALANFPPPTAEEQAEINAVTQTTTGRQISEQAITAYEASLDPNDEIAPISAIKDAWNDIYIDTAEPLKSIAMVNRDWVNDFQVDLEDFHAMPSGPAKDAQIPFIDSLHEDYRTYSDAMAGLAVVDYLSITDWLLTA